MKLPAAQFHWNKVEGELTLYLTMDRWPELTRLVESMKSQQLYVEVGKPKRPRTTGELSQNHHLNGHIQQICEETGNDFDAVKTYAKMAALPRGYPFDTIKGVVIPWSEKRLDTVQCGYLIEAVHQLAAELGIVLRE